MRDRRQLEALIQQVTDAMVNLKGDGVQEKYPIGLIDYNLWEWPQGVGLYGMYQYYLQCKKPETLGFLCSWFDSRIKEGLPEKNVNTMAPLLTLCGVYEQTGRPEYAQICEEWAAFVMHGMLRTGDGALQHMITGDPNDGQMLIDTLFMTVLFLAKCGITFRHPEYVEEAKRQFLTHIKYLYDVQSGLFFHGFDFNRMDRYGAVHWARGNAWYTCGVVDFIDIAPMEDGLKTYLLDTLRAQVRALIPLQAPSGLWRTVLDDESSYEETSASAAFAYGILKAARRGYLSAEYCREAGLRALDGVIGKIQPDGVAGGVSYGTPVGMDAQFYKDIPICPMTYGQSLALLLLCEALNEEGRG